MAILEVKQLSAGYENGFVVEDVSFYLQKGEFVSILGPNGSGKSTLLKALQGLLKNTRGKIKMDGENLLSLSPRQIAKKVAYVPQISPLSFEFTVAEIILMGRYIYQGRFEGESSRDKKVIQEVMDLTEVSHLKEKKIAHLSGGERQRVFIARALAQDSPLLFLDEPSSHLDICYQIEVYRILSRLQKEKNKTILSTEHNLNLAIPFSQKIVFLKAGRIHSQGLPEELVTPENIKEVFNAQVEIRKSVYTQKPEISLLLHSRKNK